MPGDPLKASFPQNTTGWRKDNAGVMLPMGGSSSAKALMELPKEIRDIALSANIMARGKLSAELWPKLSLLNTLAPSTHLKTRMLTANIIGGSMGEGGQASINFLQGITGMLVPSALPVADGHQVYKKPVAKPGNNNGNGRGTDGTE